jgi:SpoVK/Ycf46/Vps4 family AAA+-type ATPase
MEQFKTWLKQRERAFTSDARGYGLGPPRGVLMLGVPGAGKSLAAKAVATAWHRPLMRLDPSVLYDRYIGESERRLRDALNQAQAMAPVVLWVDEIEKGFASAATHSVDGGLSQRMFGTLLTWMQEHKAAVFLFATANNVSALPAELLRKGRFDEVFFVDLPQPPVRRAIFEIHLKRRGQDPKGLRIDLDELAEHSAGRTGSEIEAAVVAALFTAMDSARVLEQADLESALDSSPPLSVTMAEPIAALRRWAKDRCRPAD